MENIPFCALYGLTYSVIKIKNNFEPVPKSLDFVRGVGARRIKLRRVHTVRKQLSPMSNTALGQKMRVWEPVQIIFDRIPGRQV
jgi:hypothetical protein